MSGSFLPLVYIVILNYNGHKDTIACIESIEKSTYENRKIVVVDNGSIDSSEAILRKHFPDLHLIQCGRNLGFSGGNNVGIQYSLKNSADYVLLINNDTTVESGFLEPLVQLGQKELQIGIITGKILLNQCGLIWYAGGHFSQWRCQGYHHGENEIDCQKYDQQKKVSYLTGCLMLIKREVFEKVGLLDEAYFLYFEDADFCFKTIQGGFDLYYEPQSVIYHKVSSSTGIRSPLAIYYGNRNRLLYCKKNIRSFNMKVPFYLFYFISRLFLIVRYRVLSKYIISGIVDFFHNQFGYKNFEK